MGGQWDGFMWFPQAGDPGSVEVKGGSQDDWFSSMSACEIDHFEFDVKKEFDAKEGDVGKAKFGVCKIVKGMDKASAALYKACTMRSKFPTLFLALRRAGGEPGVFLQYIFQNVYINSVKWSGTDESADPVPDEDIEFTFEQMFLRYLPQKQDGSLDQGQATEWKWNCAANETTSSTLQTVQPVPPYKPGSKRK